MHTFARILYIKDVPSSHHSLFWVQQKRQKCCETLDMTPDILDILHAKGIWKMSNFVNRFGIPTILEKLFKVGETNV